MKQKREGAITVSRFFERKKNRREKLKALIRNTYKRQSLEQNKQWPLQIIKKFTVSLSANLLIYLNRNQQTDGPAQEDQMGDLPGNQTKPPLLPKNPNWKKIWIPAQKRLPLNGQEQLAEARHGWQETAQPQHLQTKHRANKTAQR